MSLEKQNVQFILTKLLREKEQLEHSLMMAPPKQLFCVEDG